MHSNCMWLYTLGMVVVGIGGRDNPVAMISVKIESSINDKYCYDIANDIPIKVSQGIF